MTSTTDTSDFRPSDAFLDSLEEQIGRRYRRNARERYRAAPRRNRFAKAAVLVIVSGSIGVTAGFASAQIKQGGARDSLLATARAEAMLAKTRLDLARAEADDVSLKVRAGAAGDQDLATVNADLRDMDARYKAQALNIEEITASGQPPRDDLGAPLVGGRDYVKLRLELEATTIQARLNAAEAIAANVQRRVRSGADDQSVLAAAQLKVLHENVHLLVLSAKLKARADFLARGTPVAELLQGIDKEQLKGDAAYSLAELNAAKARPALVEKMRSAGAASDVDLLRAQLSVKELEVELQGLAARLRAVK